MHQDASRVILAIYLSDIGVRLAAENKTSDSSLICADEMLQQLLICLVKAYTHIW